MKCLESALIAIFVLGYENFVFQLNPEKIQIHSWKLCTWIWSIALILFNVFQRIEFFIYSINELFSVYFVVQKNLFHFKIDAAWVFSFLNKFYMQNKSFSFAISNSFLENTYQVQTFLSLNKTLDAEFDVLSSFVCAFVHCALRIVRNSFSCKRISSQVIKIRKIRQRKVLIKWKL